MEIQDKEENKKSKSKMVFNNNLKKNASERGRKSDGSKLPLLKMPVPGIKGWRIEEKMNNADENAKAHQSFAPNNPKLRLEQATRFSIPESRVDLQLNSPERTLQIQLHTFELFDNVRIIKTIQALVENISAGD